MTLLGATFWGGCIILVTFGFFLEKKYGAKSPKKSIRQIEHEEIAKETHKDNNNYPGS